MARPRSDNKNVSSPQLQARLAKKGVQAADSSLRKWHKEGMPWPDDIDDREQLAAVLGWIAENKAPDKDKEELDRLLAAAKLEKANLDLAKTKREVVPVSEVKQLLSLVIESQKRSYRNMQDFFLDKGIEQQELNDAFARAEKESIEVFNELLEQQEITPSE